VTNIQLAEGGGGTLYTPEEYATFTAADIASREQFAKVEFASEQVSKSLSLNNTLVCTFLVAHGRH
jgi:hypothetical protein